MFIGCLGIFLGRDFALCKELLGRGRLAAHGHFMFVVSVCLIEAALSSGSFSSVSSLLHLCQKRDMNCMEKIINMLIDEQPDVGSAKPRHCRRHGRHSEGLSSAPRPD